MSNIYLDRLDRFVETELIPKYTRGEGRADNPAYKQVTDRIVRARRRYDQAEVRRLRQQLRTLPRGVPRDPVTDGCGTPATPTITCSGSSDPRPKLNRSKPGWRSSCVWTSSWTC